MMTLRTQIRLMSIGRDAHYLVTGRDGGPAYEREDGLFTLGGDARRETMSEAGPGAAPRKVKVLLADESPGEHRLIRALLEELGGAVELHWADSGEKAMSHFEDGRTRPDVLLIDPVLPGVDGWEVIGALRSDGRAEGLKVAVMAPQPSDYMLRRCAELKVDAILEKPVTPQALVRLLGLQASN